MHEARRIAGRSLGALALLAALLAALSFSAPASAALSPEMQKQLAESKYVYIQSQRKDGSFGKPAEIWFFADDGAVYVGSRKGSWRVRRIKAGRKAAKIHVGSANAPALDATGEILNDKAVWQKMFDAYAKKYADGWSTHEKAFRDGAADGNYVLIKYTPK